MSVLPAARAARRAAPPAAPTAQPRPATAPQLRLVAPPSRSWGFVVYLSACLALLLGGGGVVLWLNTSLAAGAFEIHKLEAELKNHETLQETTIESLVDLAEPAALAEQAAALGMEKSLATGYVILSEGSVILLPSSAEVGAEDAAGAQDGAGEEGAG